jgi:hypothetical protein
MRDRTTQPPVKYGVRGICRFCSIWTAQTLQGFLMKRQGGEKVAQIMRFLRSTTVDRGGGRRLGRE